MKGSFAKYAQERNTQVTFYYVEGQIETFSIPISPQEFQQQLPSVLKLPWLTLNLIDRTICLSMERVIKIEVKPPLSQIESDVVFSNCQQITALQRGAARQ